MSKWSRETINARLVEQGRDVLCLEYEGNTQKKSKWMCDGLHVWNATADKVMNNGTGCPVCAGKAPVSHEKVNQRIADRGLVCIEYAGTTKARSTFQCSKGHIWSTTATGVMTDGRGCPFCAGKAPVSHDEVNRRIADRGLVCIEYAGTIHSKSTFQCRDGHSWTKEANKVMAGKGCSVCAGKAPVSHDKVNRRIADRGLVCIEYVGNVGGKSTFQCSNGHTWQTSANSVMKRGGSGCPVCANYGFDPSIFAFLYYFKIPTIVSDFYKIGITNRDPLLRAAGFGAQAILLDSVPLPEGRFAFEVEQHILDVYSDHLVDTRDILTNGYTETFGSDILGIEAGQRLQDVVARFYART